MALDPKDEAALAGMVSDLLVAFERRLLTVALYGEAAGAGYRPRRSPLDVLIVLDEIGPHDLRAIRPRVRAWHRRRIGTPLLMDPRYIETSPDAFPLEFLDIHDHHRLLHGEVDPFARLKIDHVHLRYAIEEQIKGKMLHLREAYLELRWRTGPLRRLVLETPPAFAVVLRGMLELTGAERPDGPHDLLDAAERTFAIELPTLHRLERARAGSERLSRGELDAIFEAYLAEVGALARLTDRF